MQATYDFVDGAICGQGLESVSAEACKVAADALGITYNKESMNGSGHTLHLDASFIRAAHKAVVYILELAMGTTLEDSEPCAMCTGTHNAGNL